MEDLSAKEVVSSHVRSLMVNHLVDVVSSDRHTVKPWFNGKLDFSPKVIDFADKGFALSGGRLDYLNNRPVAALIYKHDQHWVNVFTWPSPESQSQVKLIQHQGYSIFHWVNNGMEYWTISDLNANSLQSFCEFLQAAS